MFEYLVQIMRDALKNHKAILSSLLECHYGLFVELSSKLVLTDREIAAIIRRNHTMYEENDELLQVMIQQNDLKKHEEFLLALKATNQEHIAIYIIKDGSKLIVD